MSETLEITVTGGTEAVEVTVGTTEILEINTETQIVVIEGQGVKGDPGQNASLLMLEIECEEEIPGKGWPIAVNRATGKGKLARADDYPLSFVVGFSNDYCAAGFVIGLESYAIELTDWTAVAGAQYLSPGIPYFLGKSGGLSPLQDMTAQSLALLGEALNPTVFKLTLDPPIFL